MTSSTSKPFEVVIIGGGVVGLTCAIALEKKGISAHIYEAAARFTEIGAGLGIGSNAVRILHQLGLIEDIKKKAGVQTNHVASPSRPGWFYFHSGMDSHELIFDYETNEVEGQGRLGVHRAAFLAALVGHIDPSRTHFNKRCTRVEPLETDPKKLKVSFADGTHIVTDVVLGADGIKSAVRGVVTETNPIESLSFSNTICYRGLIPMQIARAAGVTKEYWPRPVCYVGQDKHIIVFSISGNTLINVVAFCARYDVKIGDVHLPPDVPTVEDASAEELMKQYEGWGSEVTTLLGCIKQPSKWSINVVSPPLKSYTNGRTAVLGDAAHGMLPHLGAGAGQGIEDAEMLARLLSHPQTTTDNLDQVLKVYDEVRRPRAQAVWTGSVEAGKIFDGHGNSGSTPDGIRKDLPGMWDLVWKYNFDDDEQRALGILHDRGTFTSSSL